MNEPRELPLGLAELATLLGIKRASVDRLRARGGLPEPAGMISGSPCWWLEDLEAWMVATGRR